MNNSSAAGDAVSRRVIEEIVFQASILALHAAIESASSGGESIESAQTGDQLHRLVERVRRPRAGAEALERPEPRGF